MIMFKKLREIFFIKVLILCAHKNDRMLCETKCFCVKFKRCKIRIRSGIMKAFEM